MLDNPLVTYPETLNVADSGTYRIPCSLLGVVPLKDVKVETVEDKWVSVCGMPIGLYMDTEGVLIVDTGEIIGSDGIPCEPAANIAKSGDYILQVDGEAVTSKKDLISRIDQTVVDEVGSVHHDLVLIVDRICVVDGDQRVDRSRTD